MIEGGETEDFADLNRHRSAMVRAAVRLCEVHNNIAVGIQLQFRVEDVALAAWSNIALRLVLGEDPIVARLAFMVTHPSGVVLRHRHSETALEPSGVSARYGIALLPTDRFRSFFQHFNRSITIVVKFPMLCLGHGNDRRAALLEGHFCPGLLHVKQPELNWIHADRFCHFVDHLFPSPLELLLEVAPSRTHHDRIRPIEDADLSPIGNNVEIELGSASSAFLYSSLIGAHADVELTLAGRDLAVFRGTHLEFAERLRLDLQERQFLILGKH